MTCNHRSKKTVTRNIQLPKDRVITTIKICRRCKLQVESDTVVVYDR